MLTPAEALTAVVVTVALVLFICGAVWALLDDDWYDG